MFEPFLSTRRNPRRLTGGAASLMLHGAGAIVLFAFTATHVIERRFLATPVYLPPAASAAHPKRAQPWKRTLVAPPVPKFTPSVSLPPAPKLALTPPEAPVIATPVPPPVELKLPPVPSAVTAPVVVARKPEIRTGDFEAPTAAAHAAAVPGKLSASGFDATQSAGARSLAPAIAVGGAFGDVTDTAAPRNRTRTANTQGFDAVAAKSAPRTAALQSSGGVRSALEILSKPRPLYTEEARRLHIEGEVVLQVMFRASSQICVLHVLHGLGHGLDENAVSAAASIRFRPATEAGQPIDDIAVVRITFQLAD